LGDRICIGVSIAVVVACFLGCLLAYVYLPGSSKVELTKATWDKAVEGKMVFVKFLAPW